jgi:hypothetical protein
MLFYGMSSTFLSFYVVFTELPVAVQAVIVCILSVLILAAAFSIGRIAGRRAERHAAENDIRRIRADAVKRSRAVLGGQMVEQVAPFLPGFPCNPADVRFIGKPVDFIGFPGAAEGKPIEEIFLIEVKSGTSALSKREREIKNAVEAGRVRYVEYREPAAVEETVSIAELSPAR